MKPYLSLNLWVNISREIRVREKAADNWNIFIMRIPWTWELGKRTSQKQKNKLQCCTWLLLGVDKPDGAKARSFEGINLPSSQATLSCCVAVAISANVPRCRQRCSEAHFAALCQAKNKTFFLQKCKVRVRESLKNAHFIAPRSTLNGFRYR
jgi:hypothetical protein